MHKLLLFFIGLFTLCTGAFGQSSNKKMLLVIDSVPVFDNPEKWNPVSNADVADMTVIKNKDSLKLFGRHEADEIAFVFTKAFRNRPDSIKKIPSRRQLQMLDGLWFQNKLPYSGKYIDYYYNGRIQGEGYLLDGVLDGALKIYYPDGQIKVIANYRDGYAHGMYSEYYKTGIVKLRGLYVEGRAKGIHESFFPNGQIQVRNSLRNENRRDTSAVYYSTGLIKQMVTSKNGFLVRNKKKEEIDYLYTRYYESMKAGNTDKALKYCIQIIETDSTNADAYFKRGVLLYRSRFFDKAISALDKALEIEPLLGDALAYRGLARIKKYQFTNTGLLSKYSKEDLMAAMDFVPMPNHEREKVCNDFQQAEFAGFSDTFRKQVLLRAMANYCTKISGR